MIQSPVASAAATRKRELLSAAWQARIETGLLIVGFVISFFVVRHSGIYGDGAIRFQELSILLTQGHLINAKYPIVGPLFSAPLWLLGQVVKTPVWWVARYNVLVLAFGSLAFYLLLRRKLSGVVIRRFLLLLLTASMFPFHLKWYYGEVFTTICVGVGMTAAIVGSELGGWALAAVGVANTSATMIGFGFAALRRVLEKRRLRYLLAPVGAAAIIMCENWLKRGNPFSFRYEAGFTNPWVFGVLSILFSFGEGLIFFAPGLLLWLRSRTVEDEAGAELASLYWLWITFLIGMIVIYAGWDDWSGSWFWGPRFFLFASIPASFALAVRLGAPSRSLAVNAFTLAVLLFSFWVGINGALFGTSSLDAGFHGYACTFTGTWRDNMCFYAPELSVLWQPFIVAAGVHWNVSAFLHVEQDGGRELIWGFFSLVVFAYLAVPLIRTVAGQTLAAVRRSSSAFLAEYRPARLLLKNDARRVQGDSW